MPRTLLVVDDDADLRTYLAWGLRELGDVRLAADGLAALAVLAAEPVDVVVTDLVMPRLDGHGLCLAMQADPALAQIPVLIISGDADAQAPGVCATLRKPFNARTLRRRVEGLLGPAVA